MLRKGTRDNPSKKHLEALANFFRVAPGYFFEGETGGRYAAQLTMLRAFRDPGIRDVAIRACELSPRSLQAIAEMLDRVRKLEGLPYAADAKQVPREPAS